MMIKPEWVEAGARAYLRGLHIDDGAALRDWDRTIAAAILDAVEPIIRADERRIQHDGRECVCARTEADTEANLRERIAQEIELLLPSTHDLYDQGVRDAARVARGGESDG